MVGQMVDCLAEMTDERKAELMVARRAHKTAAQKADLMGLTMVERTDE